MKNHPIVEAIKKERQHETIEQTRARALRYVERQWTLARPVEALEERPHHESPGQDTPNTAHLRRGGHGHGH